MKALFKELSEFVRKNRKALKPAEQWLNEFDGNLDDAWNVAKNALSVDWRKIVLVVKLTLDEGEEFLLNTILSGSYSTREHPNLYLIRNALEEGKKAVKDGKIRTTPDIKPPLGEIAKLIYKKLKSLPEHEAMTLPKIAQWLNDEHGINLDETTIRTNHIPQLKPYRLYHKKRVGYCLR